MSHKKIGVFDSGVGGLTVLQQLIRLLPHESFVYFGDTARVPYGEKSGETIIRYSIESAQMLAQKDIKMLVVACNTVSSHALDHLREILNVPVVGVIEPGARKAVEETSEGRIAVLGTKATIRSQAYQKEILSIAPDMKVFPIACPLFVPLIEEHYAYHEATRLIVREYLRPLKEQSIDTLLLGCTHYPLLKEMISEELEGVHIVDSAIACAEWVVETLQENNLQSNEKGFPELDYIVSDDPQKFQLLGRSLLQLAIDHVAEIKM